MHTELEMENMLILFQQYWPKLVSSAWFAIFNLIIFAIYGGSKKYRVERFLTWFFMSPAFVSIIGEQIVIKIYTYLIYNLYFKDNYNGLFIALNIFFDAIFIVIGGMLFSYCTGLNKYVGATVYMQHVCVERLTLLIAISYVGYIGFYFIFQLVIFAFLYKDMNYMFTTKNINWKNVFLYLVGLFYILDLLYASYFLFPELSTESFNLANIFWLDAVALITSIFVLGYEKIAIRAGKEYDAKINYFRRLQSSQENIIITLTEISEAKSGETGQHVRRVSEYSSLLAKTLNLSFSEVEHIKIAAMMHDLGKLLISHEIVEKPDKLTDEEYELMKEHTQYGWDILSNSEGDIMEMARVIALQHHERWDGKGYPNGLQRDEISIYAQIVSVADVFDALTSERAYKNAWPIEKAKQEIIRQRGEQFSPVVVDAFISCFDEIKAINEKYND